MKILVISDTHGHHRNLLKVLDKIGDIDLLVHLGDSEGAEDYISALVECPVQIVAGNNDFFSQLDREKEFMIKKYRIFATHGHYYYVSMNTERIKAEAKARQVDIVMFGHTHKPLIDIQDDLITINPGSLSYPRQEGRKGSYIIMEIDRLGEVHFTLQFVD